MLRTGDTHVIPAGLAQQRISQHQASIAAERPAALALLPSLLTQHPQHRPLRQPGAIRSESMTLLTVFRRLVFLCDENAPPSAAHGQRLVLFGTSKVQSCSCSSGVLTHQILV